MTNKIIEAEKPIDHVDWQATSNNFTDERNKKMSHSLQLFPSQPAVSGGYDKTSFATTPVEITEDDALEFFRDDHTSIIDFQKKNRNSWLAITY